MQRAKNNYEVHMYDLSLDCPSKNYDGSNAKHFEATGASIYP